MQVYAHEVIHFLDRCYAPRRTSACAGKTGRDLAVCECMEGMCGEMRARLVQGTHTSRAQYWSEMKGYIREIPECTTLTLTPPLTDQEKNYIERQVLNSSICVNPWDSGWAPYPPFPDYPPATP